MNARRFPGHPPRPRRAAAAGLCLVLVLAAAGHAQAAPGGPGARMDNDRPCAGMSGSNKPRQAMGDPSGPRQDKGPGAGREMKDGRPGSGGPGDCTSAGNRRGQDRAMDTRPGPMDPEARQALRETLWGMSPEERLEMRDRMRDMDPAERRAWLERQG
ncbi:hypothetical protein [Ectothiorhodospira mobilis]|uniref:hypothetical protein n=1 Tax=Ectothiorhodospira mobilis TaxID=195064 RepID=UPI001EE7C193|nr:hypothetical protein [Ectothiorhodospira mobilis]MCG5535854.1 hypothetical protein [Ectothiorhodospira mobilis]